MRTQLIALVYTLFVTLAAASGAQAASALPDRSVASNGITVRAAPRALSGGAWEFDIAFDTHSGALQDDLMQSASLVAGGKSISPAGWQGDPPGGHHRKGVLKFDGVDPRPQEIELRIARPGEPKPRSFRWQLK